MVWSVNLRYFSFLLDNSFIRFSTKLYKQIVGIPMGQLCPLFHISCFCFVTNVKFMVFLSHENRSDVIEAVNLISRYSIDLFNIYIIIFTKLSLQLIQKVKKTNAYDKVNFWILI